ncbi:hypothetical protein vBAspATola_23 [Aeromonas phage vB_AspA_Tola]|nr:hypothetical protein vBAspATola_23 [Aeromonas phage vB_AspA_Tola]
MSFDNTCCGTTCDAKANAEYVAKLEEFVHNIAKLERERSCLTSLGGDGVLVLPT